MQQFVLIFITIVFLAAISRQILYWSWLWQLKEYRWDKLRAHFQDIGLRSAFLATIGYSALRQRGVPKFTVKTVLVGVSSFAAGIAVLVLAVRVFLPQIFLAVSSVRRIFYLKFALSRESVSLSAIKEIFWVIASFFGGYEVIIEVMIVIFFIMPVIVFFSVLILNGLGMFLKARKISRARDKIAKFPNLKVVGITGSYGKSTTKEILAELLSKKYKVLKTPVNINTPIGIARLILGNLDSSYEIFIVEMGAYKIGEIKEICDMVKPKIGIITAINEQHLALFGSIENTIHAKFELVDSLPQDGIAILNIGDENIEIGLGDEDCISGGNKRKIKAKKKLYSVGAKADAYAINVASTYQDIKFTFISGTDMKDFTLNITGAHNVSNALAAIIAAQELGMGLDEISRAIQKISRLDFTLKILAGPNGSTLIDDTYNSNPNGVLAALEYAEHQRGRKFIIMSSLIELGPAAHKIHKNLGKKISGVAAKLIFLDNYYIADIRKGAAENEDSIVEIKLERDARKIVQILENELKPTDTALFINRGARKVLELLKK